MDVAEPAWPIGIEHTFCCTLNPGFEPTLMLIYMYKYVDQKGLSCHAGCQKVSRCHAGGESEESLDKGEEVCMGGINNPSFET